MYKLALDDKKLKELINQCRHFSISPLDLPTYQRRVKHNPKIADLLSELVDVAIEDLLALSNDEIKSLVKSFPVAIEKFINLDACQNDEEELRRIAVYYIAAEVQRSKSPFNSIVNENIDDSNVIQFFPELKSRLDRDNLLLINDDLIMHDYGIEYKNYIIRHLQKLPKPL